MIINFANMKAIFRYINAKNLFEEYAPNITCRYQKMRGRGPFDKPMKFSESEKQIIISAIIDMANDLKNAYSGSDVESIYQIGNQPVKGKKKKRNSNRQ